MKKAPEGIRGFFDLLAGTTRLELATSYVTGRRSNQLSYVPQLEIISKSGKLGIYTIFRGFSQDFF